VATAAAPSVAITTTPSAVITTVPIRIVHGLVLVPATVNGRSGTWLFDTGSPRIELNGQYWRTTTAGADTNIGPVAQPSPVVIGVGVDRRSAVRTLQIGTLAVSADSTPNHLLSELSDPRRFRALEHEVHQPMLGILGLPVWQPFEPIIDYAHQRLIVIRLDTAGHRRASAPHIALIDSISLIHTPDPEHYGIYTMVGDSAMNFLLDTGAERNVIGGVAQARLQSYLVPAGHDSILDRPQVRLPHMRLGHHDYELLFGCQPGADILGFPFLSQLGMVGFNFQMMQLWIYHE
jgi:hypothetical protein